MGQPPGPGRGSCRCGRGAWDPGRCGPQRQPGRAGSQAAAQFLVPVTLAWTAQWCWRQGFPELSPLPLPRHIPPSGWGLPQKWVLGEVDVLFPWCTRTRLRRTEHAPSGGARRRERSGGGSATPLGGGLSDALGPRGSPSPCSRLFALLPWDSAAPCTRHSTPTQRPRSEAPLPSARARCRRLQEAALCFLARKRPADSHSFPPLVVILTTLGLATWPRGVQGGGPGPQTRHSHQHPSSGAGPASLAEACGGPVCSLGQVWITGPS